MPILINPKHELLAQNLAQGMNANQAYAAAGYKENRSNAAKRAKDPVIRRRVRELLNEREAINSQATAKAVEETALTKEWIINRLRENVERAMQRQPVMKDGEVVEYRYEGAVANRALELLGKERGMFIDRSENVNVVREVRGEPMSEDDWEARHATRNETEH